MLRAQSVAGLLVVLANCAFSSAGDSTPQAAVAAADFPPFAEVAGLPHLRLDDVPLANEAVSLVLDRMEVFSRDARIVVVTDAGETEAPLPPVALFAGKVAGDPQSTAFLGVSPFGTYGFVSAGGRMQVGRFVRDLSAGRIRRRAGPIHAAMPDRGPRDRNRL
ncbi:MAG: hypothetical protein HZB38_00015 [Planctomycetes bacterium]|nr:hypothetical protein [Planctomycetota bacterium]